MWLVATVLNHCPSLISISVIRDHATWRDRFIQCKCPRHNSSFSEANTGTKADSVEERCFYILSHLTGHEGSYFSARGFRDKGGHSDIGLPY